MKMKKALILIMCLTALSGCKNNTADLSGTTSEQIAAALETVSVTEIETVTSTETEQTSENTVTTSFEETVQTTPAETVSDHRITREEAKTAARIHYGLYETEIWGYETTFYYEDEIPVIEVNFRTRYNYDLEYKVNATDGSIIDFKEYPFCAELQEVISPEEAEAAALEHAGLDRDEVTFTKTEREIDNKRDIYEIEFICGGTEYEYKIDPLRGDIINFEIDD
ncbi:MAG: PepSY domain-containing protein [Oscillospiraceae bacterium]|nr:PepSY domain-containing protein [Oscillospiraceae bacterium]